MKTLPTTVQKKVKELLDQGLKPMEISRKLGVGRYAIYHVRYKMGLPSYFYRQRRIKEVKALIKRGFTASEMAQELGVSQRTIMNFRFEIKNPEVKKQRKKRVPKTLSPEVQAEMAAMLEQRMPESVIIKTLSVPRHQIRSLKEKMGLTEKRLKRLGVRLDYPVDLDRRRLFLELFGQGLRDQEVAQRLGITREAARQWRKRLGVAKAPVRLRLRTFEVLSPEEQAQLEVMLQQNVPTSVIKEEFRIPLHQIAAIRRQLGLSLETLKALGIGKPGSGQPSQLRQQAEDLLRSGLRPTEVAKMLGANRGTVITWHTRMGLEARLQSVPVEEGTLEEEPTFQEVSVF